MLGRRLWAGCVVQVKMTSVPSTSFYKGDAGAELSKRVNNRSTGLHTSFPLRRNAVKNQF